MAIETEGQSAAESPDVSLEGAASALESLLFGSDDPAPKPGAAGASGQDDGAAAAVGADDDAQDSSAAADEAPAEDAAPDESQPSGEDENGQSEPPADQQAPIEPPGSWSKDAKDQWAKLPREAQQIIADRESARDAEVRRAQNERAELDKAVETERQQRGQERAQYAQQLQHLSLLIAPEIDHFRQLDWQKLATEDPATYIAEQARLNGILGRAQAVQSEMVRVQQAQQAEQAEAQRQYLTREKAKLIESVPEFADQTTAKAFAEELSGWLAGKGFTPQEIGNITDHRQVLIVREAMRAERQLAEYAAREKQQTDAKVSAQAKKNPPTQAQNRTVKPGAVPPERQDAEQRRVAEARARLGKSGTTRDAAAFLEHFL